jgi:hypothetical protein
MHGYGTTADDRLVNEHTSRLSRLEDSFQELLQVGAQTQAVTMSINESIQEIRQDVKALKTGQDGFTKDLLGVSARIETLDTWKKSREESRKAIKTTILTVMGGVAIAVIVWLLKIK